MIFNVFCIKCMQNGKNEVWNKKGSNKSNIINIINCMFIQSFIQHRPMYIRCLILIIIIIIMFDPFYFVLPAKRKQSYKIIILKKKC